MGKWIRVISMMAGLGGSALSAQALETVDLGIELPLAPTSHRAAPTQAMLQPLSGPQTPTRAWGLVPTRFIGGAGATALAGKDSSGAGWEILSPREPGQTGVASTGVAGWGAQLLAALAAITVLMWRRVHSR